MVRDAYRRWRAGPDRGQRRLCGAAARLAGASPGPAAADRSLCRCRRAGRGEHRAGRLEARMTLLEAIPTTTATPAALPTLLLSAIVWVPALAALALLFFPSRTELHRQRIR